MNQVENQRWILCKSKPKNSAAPTYRCSESSFPRAKAQPVEGERWCAFGEWTVGY